MIKKLEWRLALKVCLLFISLLVTAFVILKGWYNFLIIVIPVVVYFIFDIYKMLQKAQDEVNNFVESIHYRDFSRNFNVQQAPTELQPLRQSFNDINSTFRLISKEKEIQYQYLQQILELVDTGILSYDIESGEMNWMNNAFKKMLNIPYLKTIHSLKKREKNLYDAVLSVQPNNSIVVTINHDNRSLKLLLSASLFQTESKTNKLIAFQNIREALDENESLAWQKLLSVMTHEIMNSIAPISSLAETLSKQVSGIKNQESGRKVNLITDSSHLIPDIELGLETIKKRSEGLLKFAQSYRNLNKVTKPNLSKVYVRDIFENILNLMHPTLENKAIEIEVVLRETNLIAEIDVNLIEQVLINLLVNAIEAVKDKEHPQIILSAYTEQTKVIIKIADNGIGISSELLDKIFIPFFSTKKTGSGIGLSLCKQIMLLHKGIIQVQSIENEGSVFSLQFSN